GGAGEHSVRRIGGALAVLATPAAPQLLVRAGQGFGAGRRLGRHRRSGRGRHARRRFGRGRPGRGRSRGGGRGGARGRGLGGGSRRRRRVLRRLGLGPVQTEEALPPVGRGRGVVLVRAGGHRVLAGAGFVGLGEPTGTASRGRSVRG